MLHWYSFQLRLLTTTILIINTRFTTAQLLDAHQMLGLPDGSFQKKPGHWQCHCLWHKILSYWHMHCPVLLSFLYRTKSQNTGGVRLNTGHLATLSGVHPINAKTHMQVSN